MILSRFYAPAILFLSSGILSAANPAPAPHLEARQQEIAITTILTTLKTTTDGILPQLDSLVAAGNLTEATVTVHFEAITLAFNTAATALTALSIVPGIPLARRAPTDDVAKLIAGIITNVVTTLGKVVDSGKTIPGLDILLGNIDTSLNQVLKGLGILLQGVLNLVANLLSNVATLLRRLALGLSLGSLGL